MPKRRLEISHIEERTRRKHIFRERHKGLFLKAMELAILTGSEVALMVKDADSKKLRAFSSSDKGLHEQLLSLVDKDCDQMMGTADYAGYRGGHHKCGGQASPSGEAPKNLLAKLKAEAREVAALINTRAPAKNSVACAPLKAHNRHNEDSRSTSRCSSTSQADGAKRACVDREQDSARRVGYDHLRVELPTSVPLGIFPNSRYAAGQCTPATDAGDMGGDGLGLINSMYSDGGGGVGVLARSGSANGERNDCFHAPYDPAMNAKLSAVGAIDNCPSPMLSPYSFLERVADSAKASTQRPAAAPFGCVPETSLCGPRHAYSPRAAAF